MISTTSIGANPKPDCVPISDWFTIAARSDGPVAYTTEYSDQLAAAGEDAEEKFRRATAEIIGDQINAGIGVVTDGEESPRYIACRRFAAGQPPTG